MKENKKSYVKPKVRLIYYSEWDVITMSSGANYLTNGEYDEENLWGGFDGWD